MSEQVPERQQGDSEKGGDPRERNPEPPLGEERIKDRIYDDVMNMVTRLVDLSPTEIAPETDILYDLGLDSLQVYELVVDLEDGYDIRLPDDELEKLHTVQDVVDLVYSLSRT
jgi:acyl carrier protein